MTDKCDLILHNILDKYIKNAKPSKAINLRYKLSNQKNKVKNKVKVDLYQTTREHYIVQLKTHPELGLFNYWLYSNLMTNKNNILKMGDEKNPLPEYSRSILYDV